MFVTSTFGMIGLFYLVQKFNLDFSDKGFLIIGLIAVAVVISYFLKEKDLLFKGFSIANSIRFLK